MLLVLLPTLYWVIVLEIAAIYFDTGAGDALSFGQLLALFVALPPVISVIQVWPKLVVWFTSLAWVRRLTQRWCVRRPKKTRTLSLSSRRSVWYDREISQGASVESKANLLTPQTSSTGYSTPAVFMTEPNLVVYTSPLAIPQPSLFNGDEFHWGWSGSGSVGVFPTPVLHMPQPVRFEPNRAGPDADASNSTGISRYFTERDESSRRSPQPGCSGWESRTLPPVPDIQ